MRTRFSLFLLSSVLALLTASCEYEFKDDGSGSSSVVLLNRPVALSSEQGKGESPEERKPAQPPDVRPTLVPGKDVSGHAALPPKVKKLNLPDLVEQGLVAVTTNVAGLGDMKNAFDEVESSLSKSEGNNPFVFTFEFKNPITLKAAKVLSTYSDYGWALDIAGSQRLVVDTIIDGEWSTIAIPEGVKTQRVRVEVLRKVRDNYVHLNEIELYE